MDNYEELTTASLSKQEEVDILENINVSQKSLGRYFNELIESSINTHKDILKHRFSREDIFSPNEILEKTKAVLSNLISLLMYVNSRKPSNDISFERLSEEMQGSWLSNPELQEYRDKLEYFKKERIDIDAKTSYEICADYVRAVKSLVVQLNESIKLNSVLELSSESLLDQDKRALNLVRRHFSNTDFDSACRTLTDYFENKLRTFLFDILVLKFGPDKWRSRLGEEANNYIISNRQRSKSILPPMTESQNILYECTRSQYSGIITEVDDNWELVFQYVFSGESKDKMASSLQLIFKFSDKDKHNLPEEYFRKIPNKLLEIILNTSKYVEMINTAYFALIKPENFFESEKGYYFSFRNLNDKIRLYPTNIEKDEGNNIAVMLQSKIKENNNFVIDLSDTDYIEHTFHTTKHKFLAVLALAIKRDLITIINKKGPRLILSLSENNLKGSAA